MSRAHRRIRRVAGDPRSAVRGTGHDRADSRGSRNWPGTMPQPGGLSRIHRSARQPALGRRPGGFSRRSRRSVLQRRAETPFAPAAAAVGCRVERASRSAHPAEPASVRPGRCRRRRGDRGGAACPSSGPRGGRLRWQKSRPRRKSSIAASRSSSRRRPYPTIGASGRRRAGCLERHQRTKTTAAPARPAAANLAAHRRPARFRLAIAKKNAPPSKATVVSTRDGSAARSALRNFSARRSPPRFRSTKPNMTRPRSSPLSTRVATAWKVSGV